MFSAREHRAIAFYATDHKLVPALSAHADGQVYFTRGDEQVKVSLTNILAYYREK
jgi:hypothetical protein